MKYLLWAVLVGLAAFSLPSKAQYYPLNDERYCGEGGLNPIKMRSELVEPGLSYKRLKLGAIFQAENNLLMEFSRLNKDSLELATSKVLNDWEVRFESDGNKPELVKLMTNFARELEKQNACASALLYYERLAKLSGNFYGLDSHEAIAHQLHLSELYRIQGRAENAESILQKVAAMLELQPKLQVPEFLFERIVHGSILISKKDYAQAQQQLEQVLKLVEKHDAGLSIRNEVWRKYAHSLYAQAKFNEGEQAFKHVRFERQQNALYSGLNYSSYLDSKLLKIYLESNEIEAISYAEKNLSYVNAELEKYRLNTNSPDSQSQIKEQAPTNASKQSVLNPGKEYELLFAMSRLSLTYAEILLESGKHLEAQKHFEKALEIHDRLKNDFLYSKPRFHSNKGVALSLIFQKKLGEAQRYMNVAFDLADRVYDDPGHPERVEFLRMAISYFRESRDYVNATNAIKKLTILTSYKDDADSIRLNMNYSAQLADIAILQEDFNAASHHYRLVLTGLEKKNPIEQTRIQLYARNLYLALVKSGKPNEANEIADHYKLKLDTTLKAPKLIATKRTSST